MCDTNFKNNTKLGKFQFQRPELLVLAHPVAHLKHSFQFTFQNNAVLLSSLTASITFSLASFPHLMVFTGHTTNFLKGFYS
jgi:hypothetical protein